MTGRRHGKHAATMPKHTSACDQMAAPTSESERSDLVRWFSQKKEEGG